MNPQELLKRIALYVSNGMPAADADRFVAQESDGRFASVQALSEAVAGVARPAPAPVKPKAPQGNPMGMSRALVPLASLGGAATGLQGLLANFGDEMYGLAAERVRPGTYRQGQQQFQGVVDQFAAENPGAATVAKVAGGVGAGLLGAPAIGAGPAAGFLGNLGAATATGALYGGLAGAGEAPTMAEVPGEAARGAGYGGLFGAGMGLLVPGLMQGGRLVGAAVSRLRQTPNAARAIAADEVGRALRAVSENPDDALRLADEAAAAGMPYVIGADANPAVARVARAARALQPANEVPLQEAISAREAARPGALLGAMERASGVSRAAAAQAVGGADDALRAARQEIYGAGDQLMLDQRSGIPTFLQQLLRRKDPVGQVVRGSLVQGPAGPRSAGGGTFGAFTLPEAEGIQRGLRQEAVALSRAGRGQQAQPFNELADRLEAMLNTVPEYQGTRPLAREAYAVARGYDEGAALAPRIAGASAEDVALMRAGSPAQQGARKAGLLNAWYEDVATAKRTGAPNQHLGPVEMANPVLDDPVLMGNARPAGRDLWRGLLQGEPEVQAMDVAARAARNQVATEGILRGGSQTDRNVMDIMQAGEAIGNAAAGGPIWLRSALFRTLMHALGDRQAGMVGAEMGKLVLSPYTPATRAALVQAMQRQAVNQQQRGLLGAWLTQGLTTGGLSLAH